MAIAKINKIQIIGHISKKDGLIRELQQLGLVQIIEVKEERLTKTKPSYLPEELEGVLNRIEEAINYISKYEERRGLLEDLVKQRFSISQEEIEGVIETFDYERTLQELNTVRAQIKELEQTKERLRLEYQALLPWRELDLPLEELHSTKETNLCLGKASNQEFSLLLSELKKEGFKLKIYFEVVHQDRFEKYLFLIYLKIDSEKIDAILKEHNFHFLSLPHRKGKASSVLVEITNQIVKITDQIEKLKKSLQKFLLDKFKLMAVYDYLLNLRQKQVVERLFGLTQKTCVIEGWIRKADLKELEQRLAGRFAELAIFPLKIRPGEKVPVVLENRRPIKPFEVVTNLYGRPIYGGIDPTPYLAPLFALSFGLCLSDAGYGLVLTLVSFFILKRFSLSKEAKKFLRLFLWGGIFTIFAGAITGSWFGNLIDRLPASLTLIKKFKDSLLLLDPLKNPLAFLVLALALGFFQVFCGVFIKLIKEIKERRWDFVFFSELPTLVIQANLLLLVLVFMHILATSLLPILWIALLISALFIIFHQCRVNQGWGLKIFWSIFGLYQIITGNFLADTLSFSRLFALGLTTGLLAMAVNEISFLIPPLLHSIGVPLLMGGFVAAGIFLFGHLANIAINLLGAYVHTSRLQYLEFFTKFFEGGGQPFRPFRIENKYVSEDVSYGTRRAT